MFSLSVFQKYKKRFFSFTLIKKRKKIQVSGSFHCHCI